MLTKFARNYHRNFSGNAGHGKCLAQQVMIGVLPPIINYCPTPSNSSRSISAKSELRRLLVMAGARDQDRDHHFDPGKVTIEPPPTSNVPNGLR